MTRRRRLIRGVEASVDLLAEITGRAPATIRRAQSQGPSKRLASDLAFLAQVLVPRSRKPVPRKPVPRKPVPRKPVSRKPVPRKPVSRKPISRKPVPRKPVPRKPVSRKPVLRKPVPRKPVPRKPVPRKPVSRKPVPRKPVPRKPISRKPVPPSKVKYPTFMLRAGAAEILILAKLDRLQGALELQEEGLGITVKSMINRDGTVDGELRVRALPALWRTPEGMPALLAVLSEAIRAMGAFPVKPPMGGAFWVSFGLRFGPKNQNEVEEMAKFYKRFRGLFQVGAYHATAQTLSAILTNALTVRYLVERVWVKRDLPPAQLLVRFVWTPDGVRPGRFAGEEGSKE